jgi:hypothetical protein
VLRNQLPIQIIASPRFLESSRHHSQNKSFPSSSSSSLLSSLQPFQWEFLQTLVSVFPSGLIQETVQEIQELVQISTEQISELIAARSSSSSSSSSTSNTTTENSPWIYLDGAYYQVNIKIQRWTPLEILSQSSHPEVIHFIELFVVCSLEYNPLFFTDF